MHRIGERRGGRALCLTSAAAILCFAVPAPTAPPTRPASHATATSDSPSLQADVERTISDREYEATETDAGLQAPNRAHGLRTYFESGGVRVVDREDGASELAHLRTISIGRGAASRELAEGEVRSEGSRVEIRRGGLVEWYENSEGGLEQGWTLAERPEGEGPLEVEVELGASKVTVDGDRAVIEAPGGRRLEYGGLAVWDASRRSLASRMEASGEGRVRLVVDDAGARYPVTVDPGLTSPAFTRVTGVKAGALFGIILAGIGDVNGDGYADVAFGAPGYDAGQGAIGGVFVFLGSPGGIASGTAATASALLVANQGLNSFASSVAGAGDVNDDGFDDLVVGGISYDGGQGAAGAAFVFPGGPAGIASGTSATAAATVVSAQVDANFGSSVADDVDVDGDGYDDLVVGASRYDTTQPNAGAAFVFKGGPAGIASGTSATAATTLTSDQTNGGFGAKLAGAGDTNGDGFDDIAVGAYAYSAGQTEEGAVFVFLGSPAGVANSSSATASATLQSDQASSLFGASVAGAGDVNGDGFDDLVVGAQQYDAGQEDEGETFVFLGSPTGIASAAPSTAATVLQSDRVIMNFGQFVGAGDLNRDGYSDVIVGTEGFTSGQLLEGGAFVFLGGPAGVSSGTIATAASVLQTDVENAFLGPVAYAGDVDGDGFGDLIVGAPFYDSPQTDGGAVYFFRGTSDGISGFPPPRATLLGDQLESSLGWSIAGAGDTNGDGFDDVVVGAPLYDTGLLDEGAAFVFLGGPGGVMSGDSSTAAATLEGDQQESLFGWTVAGAGDVNADGFDDVVVGAPGYDVTAGEQGKSFVFLGGPGGVGDNTAATADTVIQGDQEREFLGGCVAGAGDVNGDGFDDIVVGADDYDTQQVDVGAAFVFLGGPAGIANGGPATAATAFLGDQSFSFFGRSCAGAGDVNGDGYDDVVVGAPKYNTANFGAGAAFVFHGGPEAGRGGQTIATAVILGDQFDAALGTSVAGAGDTNGDGYDDVIVGALRYSIGESGEGAALVFLGGPVGVGNNTPGTADTVLQSDQADAQLGTKVAGAGDVNADGYDDVVVAAGSYDGISVGAVFVFLGRPGGGVPNGTPQIAAVIVRRLDTFLVGQSVAGVGDVNNDGFDDFAFGTSVATNNLRTGGAYVYSRPPIANAKDTPGVYVPSSVTFFLRNSNSGGRADVAFGFGSGNAGYMAIAGDWDANGVDTPGLYDPATGSFFLTNENVPGPADATFTFGSGGRVPLSGDWDGDGQDSVGLYDPASGAFFLKNENVPGPADTVFTFGAGGAVPIAGDWNGDGTDTVGLYVPSTGAFFLRNLNAPGAADVVFTYGPTAGWMPLAGDFDGDHVDTVGLYNPATGAFFLRNSNGGGPADLTFGYGPAGAVPLIGDWNGK